MMKINEGKRGVGQLPFILRVDAISISNHMAKHRGAVSVSCPEQNVVAACNTGGRSGLHTRMNTAARLMQPLRCAATHLKTSHRFLQHASNTQSTQAAARQAQRTAEHARRCSCTCTLLTRPRVTRSIIHAAQRPVVHTCIPAGAVASRRHAVATQPHMTRTSTHGENCMSMWPWGSGGSSRCRFMPGDCRAKNHTAACMSSSGLLM